MKKNKIINIFYIFIIIIILLSNIVFAANKVDSNSTNSANKVNSNSSNSANTVKNTNNSITSNKTNPKSSNANLSNLGIRPNDFSGFSENKTSYSVTVPYTVTEVEVYANKKDSKASLTGTGLKKLQEGENTADVVVTAEDGTKKTYTINIKRLSKDEKDITSTQNIENKSTSNEVVLSKLEIEGASLEPSFNSKTYKYEVNIKGEQTKLEILANANNSNDDVEIIGNENLLNGQNIITIIVTSSKSENTSIYQIYVNKNVLDQEIVNKELEETYKEIQVKIWIVRILSLIAMVGIVTLLIMRHKKRNDRYYEDEEYDDNDNIMIQKYEEKKRLELEDRHNKKREGHHKGKRFK